MLRFHKEGYPTIFLTLLFLTILNGIVTYICEQKFTWMIGVCGLLSLGFLYIILQFFRNPKRVQTTGEYQIIAPADGKVVVIEEVYEPEYFKDKRLQVSIFMSPFNVHVNKYPISGLVKYVKYHKGLYLVAWHPKSSTDNERTTVVLQHSNGKEILIRQVAGALAKRIVCYTKENQTVTQNEELGFIKFGSRVDMYLPIGTKIDVAIQQVVKGGVTLIGTL